MKLRATVEGKVLQAHGSLYDEDRAVQDRDHVVGTPRTCLKQRPAGCRQAVPGLRLRTKTIRSLRRTGCRWNRPRQAVSNVQLIRTGMCVGR